jgi:hypothetical protein
VSTKCACCSDRRTLPYQPLPFCAPIRCPYFVWLSLTP